MAAQGGFDQKCPGLRISLQPQHAIAQAGGATPPYDTMKKPRVVTPMLWQGGVLKFEGLYGKRTINSVGALDSVGLEACNTDIGYVGRNSFGVL